VTASAEAKIISRATLSAAALAVSLLGSSRLHVVWTFPPSGSGTIVFLCLVVIAFALALWALIIAVENYATLSTRVRIVAVVPCLLLVVAAVALDVRAS
jgi:hypothetical protein